MRAHVTRNNNELDPSEITAQKRHQPGKLENDTSKPSRQVLTSEAGPLSAPGQEKVTNSWHRLCTTKQQTAKRRQ